MDAQQLYDHIIKPTHTYMGGNYESKNANFLSLCTAAIESNCGYYIKQIGGPALGIWQMEPETHDDIWLNCDALNNDDFHDSIRNLMVGMSEFGNTVKGEDSIMSPMYACAMARLKYAMDTEPLPDHTKLLDVYTYYKRIYNTQAGASTWFKFEQALEDNNILDVKL